MEWLPIETAPKDADITAIVFDGTFIEIASWYKVDDQWWVSPGYTVNPTHWMPLPMPPEEV
jgi:hypothetical protein